VAAPAPLRPIGDDRRRYRNERGSNSRPRLPAELAAEVLQRRRAFEDLFLTALPNHLAAHPAALTGMTPKVYVNTCLGAVNWCYKWYLSGSEELGEQIAHAHHGDRPDRR
jgi:hypothetical protein